MGAKEVDREGAGGAEKLQSVLKNGPCLYAINSAQADAVGNV
jgi:hypothetical protein